MLSFLLIVISIYTIILLIVIAELYFELYSSKSLKNIYTLCVLYFFCLTIFIITLIKDFLYTP